MKFWFWCGWFRFAMGLIQCSTNYKRFQWDRGTRTFTRGWDERSWDIFYIITCDDGYAFELRPSHTRVLYLNVSSKYSLDKRINALVTIRRTNPVLKQTYYIRCIRWILNKDICSFVLFSLFYLNTGFFWIWIVIQWEC